MEKKNTWEPQYEQTNIRIIQIVCFFSFFLEMGWSWLVVVVVVVVVAAFVVYKI